MAAGTAWVNSGKVFTAEDGSALNPERITDWFRELTAEAGLPPIRLHDLRHGAASLMLAGGVSMETVQETQGHSSSSGRQPGTGSPLAALATCRERPASVGAGRSASPRPAESNIG